MHIPPRSRFSPAEDGSSTLTRPVRVLASSRALESPASTGSVVVLQSPTRPKVSAAVGRYTRGEERSSHPSGAGKNYPCNDGDDGATRLGSAASLSPRRRHQIASRVHARGYTHVTSTCNVSPAAPAREILLFLFLTILFFTEDINSRAREGRKRTRKKKEDALAARESNGVASERCLASQAALFRPSRPLGRGKKGGARLQVAPLLSRTPDVSN